VGKRESQESPAEVEQEKVLKGQWVEGVSTKALEE
jgi:hypothetical protein